MTQSTQYNAVQGAYDEFRKSTVTIVERVNIRSFVLPLIEDATVLDLACGSGFYELAFLRWGAKRVVGVDISSKMLDTARALGERNGVSRQLDFIEADCSKPVVYNNGPFDIVFSGWLLNYASTGKEQADFWRNIYLNLRPGGHFFGVTPAPTNDPVGHYEEECRIRPLPTVTTGLYSTVNRATGEGAYIHRRCETSVGPLDFDTYHLRKDVWESAAREAGFAGEIEWKGTHIPTDFMEDPQKYGEDSNGGASDEDIATFDQIPHYAIIHVQK